jgi:hypothetical protein
MRRTIAIMKDLFNASPEVITRMSAAFDAAVSTLPEPAFHANLIAEAILRMASQGERDPVVLESKAMRAADRASALSIGVDRFRKNAARNAS